MVKLKLKMPSDIGDVLTREELKNVFGGTGSSSWNGSGTEFGNGSGGKCGGNSSSLSSSCAHKSVGDICSYCIMAGTDYEKLVFGICKELPKTYMSTIKEKYCG